MARKEYRLTPRQRKFCEAYVRCGVGGQAAREAGYSDTRADQAARDLLKRPTIQAYLAERMSKVDITVEKVAQELGLIAFADLAEFVEWGPKGVTLKSCDQIDQAKRRAIVEVAETAHGVRIKLADKGAALDRLGRYLQMFVERHELSGPNGGPIQGAVTIYLPSNGR